MTKFVMGHGEYSGPGTFVPTGTKVGIYADNDTVLAITVGMKVISQADGYGPAREFDGATEQSARIHNYRVGPLTSLELQKMQTVASAKNDIVYIGYDGTFPGETRLCTTPDVCRYPRHTCGGLLHSLAGNDIRLVFCLNSANRSGLADVTTTLPDTPANRTANQELKAYTDQAAVWRTAVTAEDPQAAAAAIAKFRAEAEKAGAKGARDLAFLVASSNELEQELIAADVAEQRAVLGTWQFLDYLHGYPAKTRAGVYDRFRGKPIPPDADGFARRFLFLTTAERYDAWTTGLQESERAAALAASKLLTEWAEQVVPVVRQYRKFAHSDGDQVVDWFLGASLRTGLDEYAEAEAEQDSGHLLALEACIAFAKGAPVAAKHMLWSRLAGSPEAQHLLEVAGNEKHAAWPAPEQTTGDPVSRWLREYRAQQESLKERKQPSPPPHVQPTVAAAVRQAAQYGEYWDDVDMRNRSAVTDWDKGKDVWIVQYGNLFRFADAEDGGLAQAFPTVVWGKYRIKESTFTGVEVQRSSGTVDHTALNTYLSSEDYQRTVRLRIRVL